MEHFYYTSIHQALQSPIDQAKKATVLKRLKAKIIRLHSQQQRILLANGNSDGLLGEAVSVHPYITVIRRTKARTETQIQDGKGNSHMTSSGILRTFTKHKR